MTRLFIKIILAVVFLFVVAYGSTVWYVVAHMDGTATLPTDCGIVFGTAVHPVYNASGKLISATAGPGIIRRVSTAASLYKQGMIKRIFLTGGKGEGSLKSEAQVMRDVALQRGIPSSAITVEDRSRSTEENLEFTRPLTLGCSGSVAISDGYHLARIELLADSMGWELHMVPADKEPTKTFILQNLLREAIGIDLLLFTSYSR